MILSHFNEYDLKNIADALEAIKVNLADYRKPKRIVPISRANVWCSRCGDSGHFSSECFKGPQRRVHLVDPEIRVYYSVPQEELEPETNPVFRVQIAYGRGKGVTQIIQSDAGARPLQIRTSQGLAPQGRYPVGVCWSCGDPTHFANVCPNRGGQGAPLILPCQNCGEYGHQLQQCPKPQQVCQIFKQVEVPPRDQTVLNYASNTGVENPDK